MPVTINHEDRCIMCGELIPEGIQVCPTCQKKYDREHIGSIKELASILRLCSSANCGDCPLNGASIEKCHAVDLQAAEILEKLAAVLNTL